jgi:hypothetical protein
MRKMLPLVMMTTALGLTACGGSNNSSSTGSSTGTLSVAMTDSPSCGYDHVYVTVQQVRVNASATAADNDAGWQTVTIANPTKTDLLSLTNGVLSQLGQTPLPSGKYQQIRLVLAANTSTTLANSIVPTGGTEQPLATPSSTQSGYKVVGEFTVQPNTLTDLVLDFDACHSVVQKGNSTYSLKPVVTATPVVVSGSISGSVATNEVGATVYAEQNGKIVKGTTVKSDGSFTLTPLVQSTTNGNYDVVVVDNGFASAVIRSVPVVASSTTTVSTTSAPITAPAAITQTVVGTATPAADGIVVNGIQTSNGASYVMSSTNANITTGAYTLSLTAGAPYIGTYSGSLPVALAVDTAVNGKYSITAVNSTTGASQTVPVNISASSASNINFSF